MKRTILIGGLLLALAPAKAPAHGLWIEAGAEGITILEGHRDGDDHSGAAAKNVPGAEVVRVVCAGDDGATAFVDGPVTWPVFGDRRCAAFCGLVSSGYWTKTVSGTVNLPKDVAEHPLTSWLSFESAKAIFRWSDAFNRPLTDDLEIVPLHDPTVLAPGDKLRLVVTLGGAGVPDAVVLVDGKPRGTTDHEGLVNVKLRQAGFQSIVASHRSPADGMKADEIVRTAVLDFRLGDAR